MTKVIITAVVVLALVFLIGLLVIYSGWYNVAATSEHNSATLWILETTTDRSIESHAGDIEVPPLSDSAMVARGFDHFDAMCVQCHGAPGIGRDEFAEGLYPLAPTLSAEVEEWSPAELFWITKHGIKMTGMPAFGETHSDDAIWDIVAFLQVLSELGYYDYLEMRDSGNGAEGTEGEAGHGHEGHEH